MSEQNSSEHVTVVSPQLYDEMMNDGVADEDPNDVLRAAAERAHTIVRQQAVSASVFDASSWAAIVSTPDTSSSSSCDTSSSGSDCSF